MSTVNKEKIKNIKHTLFAYFMTVSCILCFIFISGKAPLINQALKRVEVNHHFSIIKMVDLKAKSKFDYNKGKNSITNIFIDEQDAFDGELFDKFIRAFFSNSMLFSAFLALLILSIQILIASIRRGSFAKNHYYHIKILMNYIHRTDGEWEQFQIVPIYFGNK